MEDKKTLIAGVEEKLKAQLEQINKFEKKQVVLTTQLKDKVGMA